MKRKTVTIPRDRERRTDDIVVTMPATLPRDMIMRQLEHCYGRRAWHYCMNRKPRELPRRLHFCHRGDVIGSLPVLDVIDWSRRPLLRADGAPLMTEGRRFCLRAQGRFTPQQPSLRMAGFRGWRFFDGKCLACGGLGATIDDAGNEHPCADCGGGRV